MQPKSRSLSQKNVSHIYKYIHIHTYTRVYPRIICAARLARPAGFVAGCEKQRRTLFDSQSVGVATTSSLLVAALGLFLSDPGQQISPRAMEQADAARRLQKGNNICFGDLFRVNLEGLPEPIWGLFGPPVCGPALQERSGGAKRGSWAASWGLLGRKKEFGRVKRVVRTGPERSRTNPSNWF